MTPLANSSRYYAILLALAGTLCACERSPKEIRRVKLLMGTKVEIIAQGRNEASLAKAVELGFQEFERLEAGLSRYRDDSEVSKINRNAGVGPVQVSPELFMLLEKSLEICKDTGGAFDITILPVLSLWNFNEKNARPPSEEEVRQKLSLVDCQKIILKKDQYLVFLPEPGMGIDLGGIAKGYAVDRVAELLKRKGVSSGIVSAGGDMRVFGGKGRGLAVGIQDPRNRSRVLAKIYLKDSAISTSGDYERFFIFQGVRYAHILDPRSGHPAQGEESVSVVGESGLSTDAWATALFVLGSEEGLQMLKTRPGMEALFIDASGRRRASPELETKLVWLEGAD